MRLVSVQEMLDIERAADAAGLKYAEMMDRAGKAVAAVVSERLEMTPLQVLVLVGPGNNGGDGLVAARELHHQGHVVTVYLWKRNSAGGDALLAGVQVEGLNVLDHAQDGGLSALTAAAGDCDVVIDALLGTGARGPLRGGAEEITSNVAAVVARRRAPATPSRVGFSLGSDRAVSGAPLVVAVDVPSGLDADTGEIDERALAADLSISFAFPKRGQFRFPGAAYVGELLIADIGIALSVADEISAAVPAAVATAMDVGAMLPPRPADSHKGTYGKALIVAGSINYVGAPALAARAAYRSGAGLVTLAIPAALQGAVAGLVPEATFVLLPSDMGVIAPQAIGVLAERVQAYDALLLGPGLSQETPAVDFVRALLEKRNGRARKAIGFTWQPVDSHSAYDLPPMVIDADGLNLLSKMDSWPHLLPPKAILTPHPGEMARLLGQESIDAGADRVALATEAATNWGCTLALKGAYTVIATPERDTVIIPFAEAALATAGTGDVLAGTITSLLAQGLSCHEAAVCGTYLHGLAGALWARKHGHAGMLAGDLAEYLPLAQRTLRQRTLR
jgi:ADP-dependent NAD(P)H-hydrate dehydratase / NAD(P)H-hydrate epimerase